MTMTDDNLETPRAAPTLRPEPKRDQWDRALLLDPDGNRMPYTRVSTIAKALDAGFGLEDWRLRCAAVGLKLRPDLWSLACSIRDPEGVDKPEMTRIVREAAQAGDVKKAANEGTARHKFTEQVEQGADPATLVMTDAVRRDVEAYFRELDRLGLRVVPEYTELHMVREGFDYQGLGVSGTMDCAVRDALEVVQAPLLWPADKKTSQSVKYSLMAWTIQLAVYANMEAVYDVATDTRSPVPRMRTDVGLLLWLPTGAGRCEVHELDLVAGWEMAQLAVEVRRARWRGARDLRMDDCLARPFQPVRQLSMLEAPAAPAPTGTRVNAVAVEHVRQAMANLVDPLPSDGPAPPPDDKRRDWLKQRLRDMPEEGRAHVAAAWTAWNELDNRWVVPPLSGDHRHTVQELDLIEGWCNEAEAICQHDLSADPTVVAARNVESLMRWFPGTIDEGSQLNDAERAALPTNMALWCKPEWHPLIADWREDAIRLGRDFGPSECPTYRRALLYELAANLCNLIEGDMANVDMAWAVLVSACGWTTRPDIPLGYALAFLTIDQATTALEVCAHTPFLALSYAADGTPSWQPVKRAGS